jgi:hypothetical protein
MANQGSSRLGRQTFARLHAPIARHLAARDRAALVYGATVLLLLPATRAALLVFAACCWHGGSAAGVRAWRKSGGGGIRTHETCPQA